MSEEEFLSFVSSKPTLATSLKQAAASRTPVSFGLDIEELAALIFMYPIVKFISTQIGLPWLYEASRYSELWRLKFHAWIDEQYRKNAIELVQAEAAGDALRERLQTITNANERATWEHLAKLLVDNSDGDKSDADKSESHS